MTDEPTMIPAEGETFDRTEPRHHNLGLRIAKWVGIVLLALVVLIAAVLLSINTGPGKRFVVRQIEALEFENGMQIGIGRIDGSIYGRMTIRDLAISDPQGVFVSSPEVAVDWRPFAFVNGHIDVRALTSPLITLARLPQFNETPPSDAPLLPDYDIDVDTLRIGRFVAEAPVSGQRRIVGMDGEVHIADGRAQVDFNGRTIGGAGISGGDTVALVLDAVPEDNKLDIDLDLNAPAGGVIAAMAGLTDPLRVQVNGRGSWTKWDGRLNADLAGDAFARVQVLARDGTFTLRGPTRVARLFEGPTATLLGPILNLDLTGRLDERRVDLAGNINSDAFRLNTQGLVDLSDNSFDELRLGFVLLKPAAIAPNLAGSGLRAQLVLDGAFATPAVQYQINATRLFMNDMGLENLAASGAARVDADQILIPVDARVSRIVGLDTVAGGTLRNVRLAGDLAIDGTRILSDNLRIRSDRIDAGLIVVADTSTGLYTGAIDGRIDNYRLESVGIFNIDTDIDLKTVPTGGFAMQGRVRARSTRLLNDSVLNFLGGNAVAATDVLYGPDGVVRFSNLRLDAPDARITGGRGSWSPDGRLTLALNGTTTAYGAVGVQVAGTIANPNATITVERPGFGIGLADVQARITGARGGYRLQGTAATDYGPLTADVVLATSAPLTLTINNANLGGIDVAGRVQQTNAGPFAGQLTANGNGLGGVVRLSALGQYQQALVNLRARNTVLPGPAQLAIGSAIVDAQIVLYDQPRVVADAQLAQTRYGALNIVAARAQVDYQNGRGLAKVLAEGTSGVPFRVAMNADLQPELWRAALQGRVRGIDFRTASPARIVPGDGTYELLPTRITFGEGDVRLAGQYGEGIELQTRLDRLDLTILNAFAPGAGIGGRATGSLDFAQASSTAFPSADARLSIDNFTRTTAAAVSRPIDINFVGKLLPDGGEARAVMRDRGAVIGRMVASLRPLGTSAGTWSERLLAAPLSGGIRYNGPADTLFSFAGQVDQSLSGPVGVAADFSGTVSAPSFAGLVRSSNLTYQNQTYGTRLTNMAIDGRFTGDRLEVRSLTARAGDGTVSANGFVSLAADAGYPMNIAVTMDNAELADSDQIAARATGNLRLTKAAGQNALLAGQIRLPETRYQIVRQGAAEVPTLTGVRFKPPRGPQRITGDEPAEPSAGLFEQLALDIDLVAPERLYVSGMGLESEWRANFNVAGTSAAPSMSGEVELIRGTLGFAGRSFELSDGRVQFTGGNTIDPQITIVATEDIEDVTVNVNVEGRAFNPQITFSSTPGLPQDEILSRILFGSSVGNLSAIQAVQLAASLNSLRGSGGGLNPLGQLRAASGIDRLRILGSDDETGRGTALAAGQYLTDDIYVEFITDAQGFTATQLEVSLTPALSILSQAGGSGATNVSARYRKNY
ncbi:translocation/assembly module TamB domain-containing protein [Croceibacterium sp. TMG7-5b_MA50]|uniref:translocation/assembly module TamB domain-containing protein n=1 Tax=Croceibacterium sp. TMG7-5b_MA50 TaxID=3121290 RepID=UPI003221A852